MVEAHPNTLTVSHRIPVHLHGSGNTDLHDRRRSGEKIHLSKTRHPYSQGCERRGLRLIVPRFLALSLRLIAAALHRCGESVGEDSRSESAPPQVVAAGIDTNHLQQPITEGREGRKRHQW